MEARTDSTGGAEGDRDEGRGGPGTWLGQQLRSLTEYAMDIIMIIDSDAIIKYINRASHRLLGYGPEEMTGRSGLEFIHPDDVEWASQMVANSVLDPDYSETRIIRVRHADGTWRHLEGIGRNFLSQPEIAGIVLSFRDLTERLRVEEELRDSEELYRTLVRISPDAVTVTDLQGWITFVSPQTLSMHGYESEEELLGKSVLVLIDPSDHDKATSAWRKTLRGDTVRNVELAAVRKGGKKFTAELNASSISDAAGEPRSLVGFVRDITDRKTMERELRKRNEELEAFAHTISHDLLTPVAIVEGYAKAALEADAEGRAEAERECLEAIARGTRRMNELINSLLQYAQAGHMETEALGADSEEVLLEVLLDLEEELRGSGTRVEIGEDLPRIEVDAVKLRQVFGNLISNALRHMGEVAEPRVEVGAMLREGEAVFHVRDNGTGIPSDLHQKIFEPFRHFSLSGAAGLGIGLSTVKRAVNAWGGRVWVESRPGEGAVFFFSAPLAGH